MKKLEILFLTAVLAASLCGCVWFMDAGEEGQQGPAAYEPVQDVIEATPEPKMADNPVSLFYSDYYAACGAMRELFQSRLEGEATKEAADTLIYLAEHELIASEGKVTFGWLLSTDSEGSFSSSVSGAADGSGTISPGISRQPAPGDEMELISLQPEQTPPIADIPGEGEEEPYEYTLQFQFAAGDALQGTLTQSRLEYSQSRENGYQVEIITEDGVWESTVTRGSGLTTLLRCDNDGLHFTVSGPAQQEMTETIYQWTSDSAGARRI